MGTLDSLFVLTKRLEPVLAKLITYPALSASAHAGINTIGLRARALIDLTVLVGTLELVLWVWKPLNSKGGMVLGATILAVLAVGVWIRSHSVDAASLRQASLKSAWSLASWCTVGGTLSLLAIAWSFDVLEQEWGWQALDMPRHKLPGWFLKELGLILLQQVFLQRVIYPLTTQIVSRRWVALALTGSIFSLLHMPNPLAVVVTFIIAPLWCLVFIVGGGRWLPVVLSHMVLVLVTLYALPWHITLGLAIGPKAIPRLQMLTWVYEHKQVSQLNRYGSQAFYEEVGGTDAAFVDVLFRRIKGRGPTDEEKAYFLARLTYHTHEQVAFRLLAGHVVRGP